ncbi:hypothetical protein [Kitasatospora sp. NPDC094011]|uniref:hypothetical protein n=1 Tax=Kitasatospora sp. NPDC094011 TaxID=3364090 RepID=UPI0037F3462F
MPLREYSNLGWPETPYAADQRPVAKHVRLLTGMSILWADAGEKAVPIGAAAVFIPVHRTARRDIAADTLHFGYRAVTVGHDTDAADTGILAFLDGILVQARREAEIIALHSFADDIHGLRPLLTTPYAGIDSVTEAWNDRSRRERATAMLVDTADDGMQLDSALTAARLDFGRELWRHRAPMVLQQAYEDLWSSTGRATNRDWHTQHIGAAGVMSALAVALIAGRQTQRLDWAGVFNAAEPLGRVAWDTFPLVLALDELQD